MTLHFKLLILFLMFFPCFFYGENEIRLKSLDHRVEVLEQNKKIPYRSVTPNAGPRVEEKVDFFLTAHFIYWKTRVDSLTYAQTGRGDITSGLSASKGELYSIDWKWEPGFKAGFGWSFCRGGWDLLLQYTWLYSNALDSKKSSRVLPSFDVTPPDVPFLLFEFMNFARARFYLHYHVGDLQLSRNYYVNRFLKMHPFVGLKGTWQKQKYLVFYDSVIANSPPFISPIQILEHPFNLSSHHAQVLWGMGARAGLNTSWQFNRFVSLYGNLAFTGIWVHYRVDRKDKLILTSPALISTTQSKFTFNDLRKTLRLIRPVLEFALGLRFESYFNCRKIHAILQGGWESQIWINHALYINTGNQFDQFDLDLHGLSAKFRIDF